MSSLFHYTVELEVKKKWVSCELFYDENEKALVIRNGPSKLNLIVDINSCHVYNLPDLEFVDFHLSDETVYHAKLINVDNKNDFLSSLRDVLVSAVPSEMQMERGWLHSYIYGTLHSSIIHNDVDLLKQLLELSIYNVDELDNDGFGPIHYASSLQSLESLELLIEHHCDVNLTESNEFNCALHMAIQTLNSSFVSCLISNEANPNVLNLYEQTPIFLLYQTRTYESEDEKLSVEKTVANITSLLLMSNMCTITGIHDAEGLSPLAHAALGSYVDAISILFIHGADINETHEIQLADDVLQCNVLTFLFYQDKKKREEASERIPPPNIHLIQTLLECGIHPNFLMTNSQFEELDSALHMLVEALLGIPKGSGDLEDEIQFASYLAAVTKMIEFGASIQLINKQRLSCLDMIKSKVVENPSLSHILDAIMEANERYQFTNQFRIQSEGILSKILEKYPCKKIVGANTCYHCGYRMRSEIDEAKEFSYKAEKGGAGVVSSSAPGSAISPGDSDDDDEGSMQTTTSAVSEKPSKLSSFFKFDQMKTMMKNLVAVPEGNGMGGGVKQKETKKQSNTVCIGCFNALQTLVKYETQVYLKWEEEKANALKASKNFADEPAKNVVIPRRTLVVDGSKGGVRNTTAGASSSSGAGAANASRHTSELQDTLALTHERLQQRGEKVNRLEEKTAKMASDAQNFASLAEELKMKAKRGWF
jgi:ankyrin repeat protein